MGVTKSLLQHGYEKENQFKKKLKFLKREDLQRSCPLKTLQGAFNLLVAKKRFSKQPLKSCRVELLISGIATLKKSSED